MPTQFDEDFLRKLVETLEAKSNVFHGSNSYHHAFPSKNRNLLSTYYSGWQKFCDDGYTCGADGRDKFCEHIRKIYYSDERPALRMPKGIDSEERFYEIASNNLARLVKEVDTDLTLKTIGNGLTHLGESVIRQTIQKVVLEGKGTQRQIDDSFIRFASLFWDAGFQYENVQTPGEAAAQGDSQNFPKVKSRNVVCFGPPGTGKTRYAILLAASLIRQGDDGISVSTYPEALEVLTTYPHRFIRTQFHPNYAYEDFVEGIRPVKFFVRNKGDESAKEDVRFTLIDGPLKAACHIATNRVRLPLEPIPNTPNRHKVQEWASRLYKAEMEFEITETGLKNIVPGEDSVAFERTFSTAEIIWQPLGTEGEGKHVVLVIDELNRGDVPRIFGETLTAIEDEYRSPERPGIQLQHSKEELRIPDNLSIICTMNLADRTLVSLDQAFRRRFEFIELSPMLELLLDGYSSPARASTWPEQKRKLVEKINRARPGVIDRAGEFIGHLLFQLNECIDNPDRHFGHSFGLKAMDAMLENGDLKEAAKNDSAPADLAQKYYLACIKETVNLWHRELAPQLRTNPAVNVAAFVQQAKKQFTAEPQFALQQICTSLYETSLWNDQASLSMLGKYSPKVSSKDENGILTFLVDKISLPALAPAEQELQPAGPTEKKNTA